MTPGNLAQEILEPTVPHASRNIGDDPKSEWVAANAGKVFTEQVRSSTEVASCGSADYLDVMAFPVHRATADRTGASLGDGVVVGDGEPEARVGGDCEAEQPHYVGRVHGPLRLSVGGGGLVVRSDNSSVILDRGSSKRPMASAVRGLFWALIHDYRLRPRPEVALR